MSKDVNCEEGLMKAIADLEAEEQPSGGSIAQAFGMLKSWLSEQLATLTKARRPVREAEDLIEDLELDEEEPDYERYAKEDEYEDEGEYEDEEVEEGNEEEEEYEDEEEEEEELPGRRRPFGKSLNQAVNERLGNVIAGDEVVAQLLAATDEVQRSREKRLRSELAQVRKALAVVIKQLNAEQKAHKSLAEELEAMGRIPLGSMTAGPYRRVEKGGQAKRGEYPSAEEADKMAVEAMRKGLLTAGDRRAIELAYQGGDPSLVAEKIARAKQASTLSEG